MASIAKIRAAVEKELREYEEMHAKLAKASDHHMDSPAMVRAHTAMVCREIALNAFDIATRRR